MIPNNSFTGNLKNRETTPNSALYNKFEKQALIHFEHTSLLTLTATIMIDPATKLRESRMHMSDPNEAYTANHDRFSGDESSPLRFAVKSKGDGVDLDASSPRLWKTSPASSPPPETRDSNSRTEAIERGRKELMEMIKDLPESFYELSLRDIVDQNYSQIAPNSVANRDFTEPDDENRLPLMAEKREEKKKVKKTISRCRSVDKGGYLLKTSVFPISFALRRNKKRKEKKKGLFSNAEKEWWRRKSSEESESSVGLSSNNSESSSQSTSRSSSSGSRQGQSSRFLSGCCSFRNN